MGAKRLWLLLVGTALLLGGLVLIVTIRLTAPPPEFDGERAYADVVRQVEWGPRVPGSIAHSQTLPWISEELGQQGWSVSESPAVANGIPVRNIVARRGSGRPWLLLGAHYDSRLVADEDSDPLKAALPVPGANDGASGVAVLVELGRVLPHDLPGEIWLVFFDMEDNGRLEGYDWIMGSRAFVSGLETHPDQAVIVDMIGDANLNIMIERNSNQEISRQIWQKAADLGYGEQFIAMPGYSILDDHTPFLEADIPAVDIIDFDYPYWHTSADTPDKVSAQSLNAVGDTLLAWIRDTQQLAK